MKSDRFLQPLGTIALGIIVLPLAAVVAYGAFVLLGVTALIIAVNWLHEQRMLAPITLGLLIGLVVIHFAGCAAAPSEAPGDPRDPQIWRPSAPASYPLPR